MQTAQAAFLRAQRACPSEFYEEIGRVTIAADVHFKEQLADTHAHYTAGHGTRTPLPGPPKRDDLIP